MWLLAHFKPMNSAILTEKQIERDLSTHLKNPYKKANRKQLEKIILQYKAGIKNCSQINVAKFDQQCTTVSDVVEGVFKN